NDGDPDLLVSACGGRPALLRNDGDGGAASWPHSGQRSLRARTNGARGNPGPGPGRNHWLQVKAIAGGLNREGIGTKVMVTAGGQRQTGWIRSGSSYCSQSELTAFFGLGGAGQAESVELRFPSGARQTLASVKADQMIVVQEGKGLVAQGAPGAARPGSR